MDGAAAGASVARRLSFVRDASPLLAAFTATLFLSALLLFSVQPMFARMVLPQLGGSPSVWAVSMCFFQGMLLVGYAYAHLVNRHVPLHLAPLVHLSVMGLAVLTLPVGLPATWSEPPAGDAYLWLMGLLAAGVGLPFFAVAANAPLLQAWFARSGHPHANDPYFLYGASNVGSLMALLAYPVVLEPLAGLGMQALLWMACFIVLGFAIAACGLLACVRPAPSALPPKPAASTMDVARPSLSQRLAWIALAFVPSGLLVAFTTHVTTDIASAPFLWVIPLAVFLATFIAVFRDRPLLPHRAMLLLQPLATAGVVVGFSIASNLGGMAASVAAAIAFFTTTMVCHKELYERRPASAHLTEFYLWMSLGGVLGGMFAALLAPQLFNAVWEFPLLLVLGMLARPGVMARLQRADAVELAWAAAAIALVAAALKLLLGAGLATPGRVDFVRLLMALGCALLAVINFHRPQRQAGLVALAGLAIVLLPATMTRGYTERSFFGVHRVATTSDGQFRLLTHGTTIHGAQRLNDGAERPVPTVYYHPASSIARAVDLARRATGKSGAEFRAGVVGLGAGVMACNARPGERWRFYEIDPVVVRIASDPAHFTFLAACQPHADFVIGDARLTLAREADGSFDYLLIDAFASDAVPVHLLTREAIALYLDKLTPDGVLVLHVSNRHLDLPTVASSTAKSIPETFVVFARDRVVKKSHAASASHVVLVTRSHAAFELMQGLPNAQPMHGVDVAPWSDDFSDIISALWRKARS
jgi:hypothetical protein